MMKLDTTLKNLGTVLRRQLADVSAVETPSRIAELLKQLARVGQSGRSSDAPNLASGPK